MATGLSRVVATKITGLPAETADNPGDCQTLSLASTIGELTEERFALLDSHSYGVAGLSIYG